MKTKILDQIRGSEQGMLQLLEELVNIDSGADALAGINAVAQRIGAFLEVLGFTVEYLETDGAPVQLLARKAQPGKSRYCFQGIWIRCSIKVQRRFAHSRLKTDGLRPRRTGYERRAGYGFICNQGLAGEWLAGDGYDRFTVR